MDYPPGVPGALAILCPDPPPPDAPSLPACESYGGPPTDRVFPATTTVGSLSKSRKY